MTIYGNFNVSVGVNNFRPESLLSKETNQENENRIELIKNVSVDTSHRDSAIV